MVGSQTSRELEFTSVPENVNKVEAFVEVLKTDLQLSEEMEANILVSLSEAVNNAIVHGNKNNPAKKVSIKMEKDGNLLSFVVADEGEGFDPGVIIDPTAPENLDKPSGRGIFLMRSLADKVEFIDGGRKVNIAFNLA
ncbi:MAG: ATP-binding protein [Chitinophagales bacterium]|nr:ATP-binding protein [Chitinophagales bacterium]